MIDFSVELQSADISPGSLLKRNSATETLLVIFKILAKLTGNFCGGVSFQYVIVDRLDCSNCLIETRLKLFYGNFPKLSNQQFFGASL